MIPEEILDKPGRLTDEEFAIMKSHVLYGDALLEKCPGEIMKIARIIAKEHHEKWDGTGKSWSTRIGRPADIAGMVAYLCSPEADYILGQNFIVDGGRTLGLKGN